MDGILWAFKVITPREGYLGTKKVLLRIVDWERAAAPHPCGRSKVHICPMLSELGKIVLEWVWGWGEEVAVEYNPGQISWDTNAIARQKTHFPYRLPHGAVLTLCI